MGTEDRRARQRFDALREPQQTHPQVIPLLTAEATELLHIDAATPNATLGAQQQRARGHSFQLADRAWNAIDSHIYGFTLQELNFPLERSDYASAARGFLPMLPAEQYPYMRELTQLVADGAHQGVHQFEFGLELLLDGLERLRTQ